MATLGLDQWNTLINDLREPEQQRLAEEEFSRIEPGIQQALTTIRNQGALILLFRREAFHPDSPLTVSNFDRIEVAFGQTQDEARTRWRATPHLRAEAGTGSRMVVEEQWIPPLDPTPPSELQSTFPRHALATFAFGTSEHGSRRVIFENVAFTRSGFDNISPRRVQLPEGVTIRFFVLRPPASIRFGPTDISLSVIDRPSSSGITIPVLDLDPWVPFVERLVACIFPADEIADSLFSRIASPTANYRNMRQPNASKVRWVRPEYVRVLDQ